jgi:uncharacterized membrane protein
MRAMLTRLHDCVTALPTLKMAIGNFTALTGAWITWFMDVAGMVHMVVSIIAGGVAIVAAGYTIRLYRKSYDSIVRKMEEESHDTKVSNEQL